MGLALTHVGLAAFHLIVLSTSQLQLLQDSITPYCPFKMVPLGRESQDYYPCSPTVSHPELSAQKFSLPGYEPRLIRVAPQC